MAHADDDDDDDDDDAGDALLKGVASNAPAATASLTVLGGRAAIFA